MCTRSGVHRNGPGSRQSGLRFNDHSVDNLALRRALILDETCDPILRTTLNRDSGALEFAAFTATAGGDLKWTITATAELNTLSRSPDRTIPQVASAEHSHHH